MSFSTISSTGSVCIGTGNGGKNKSADVAIPASTRRDGIIFGYLPYSPNNPTTNLVRIATGDFVRDISDSYFSLIADPCYNSTSFYPLLQLWNSDGTLNKTITSELYPASAFISFPTDSYVTFKYIINSSYVDPICNGEVIIRFSRLRVKTGNLTNLNIFMATDARISTGCSMPCSQLIVASTDLYYMYDIGSKDKQILKTYNGIDASYTRFINYPTNPIDSSYPLSTNYGPFYMSQNSTSYVNSTDGIYGDFIELEFARPVTLKQFSFYISSSTPREYPRINAIIGSNTLDANGQNILYSKNDMVFGICDTNSGVANSSTNPAINNLSTGASSSNWYTIKPSTTAKYQYFRFIGIGIYNESYLSIRNLGFKVDF